MLDSKRLGEFSSSALTSSCASYALVAALVMAVGCAPSRPTVADEQSTPSTLLDVKPASVEVADRLERQARVDGSTFIEILDVVAQPNGRLLYCTGVRGLQVVDSSNMANPHVIAELRSSRFSHERFARCQHLAIDGDRVYFTSRGDMVQKTPFITGYDLSTTPPTEILNYTLKGATFEGIAASGGKLFVAMHGRGLAIMEPSKDTLVELSVLGGFRSAWSVAVEGRHAYVADATGSLTVVDISNPRQPRQLGRVQTGGSAQSVVVSKKHAFVAAGAAGLIAVDISVPTAPTIVSQTKTNGSALQVTVNSGRAYVANWRDARIYDVRDPKRPQLMAAEVLKTKEPSSRVLGMSGLGDRVFVGEWTGLYTYQLHPKRMAPHLSASRGRLDFDRTQVGKKSSRSLHIKNEGTAALIISSLQTSGDGFAVLDGSHSVEPGRALSIDVSFQPSSSAQATGELVVQSNDPDEQEARFALIGNQTGLAVGDVAPDVSLALVDGGQWRLSEQRGKVVVLAYFATF